MIARRLSLVIALSMVASLVTIAPAGAQARRESVNDATLNSRDRPVDIFDSSSGLNMNQLIQAAREWDNPRAGDGIKDESIDAEVERFRQTRSTRFGPEIFGNGDSATDAVVEPTVE
ncbi:MAG: hypothetical protein AAF704_11400 [Cyanobacteria bacterium P01_D01_bin.123]